MTVFSTQDKNKAMPQKKLLVIGLFSLTVALSGCATDGNYYRSDVYSSSQMNQAQRVNTVEIIAINPAQVAVNNSENSDRARGAIGGLAGDAVGGSGTTYVDGVQLVYRSSDGQVYQSTQVGRICEYKLGSAIMASSRSGETRIQPNNPYGCGKR